MATAASILLSLPEPGITVDELAQRANAVLSMTGLALADGRTASRIDTRTIRFYQTLGLIPKPEYEGRRALYSTTHLLRIVAAKQLQSEGYSLAQIQASLPARPDTQLLRAISQTTAESVADSRALRHPRGQDAHAAHPPSPVASPVPSPELRAFTLAKGVTLLVDTTSTPDPESIVRTLTDALARASDPSLQ
ncbi:MAG: MerR family transcriptional regulator [Phycisphaerales bacterium]|nr:MerR family transcriptional regulator [Phycisphaerales bacterium]